MGGSDVVSTVTGSERLAKTRCFEEGLRVNGISLFCLSSKGWEYRVRIYLNRFLYKNRAGGLHGSSAESPGTDAALSSLQSPRQCQGRALGVAVGETEQKTPGLCSGQVGDGGQAAGSDELPLLSLSLAAGLPLPAASWRLVARKSLPVVWLIHFALVAVAGSHCSHGLSSLAVGSDQSFSRSESDAARWLYQA